MSVESERPSSNAKIVLLIVVIVSVVLLVVVATCAGLGYLAMRSMSQGMSKMMDMVTDMQLSQTTAQTFLNDLAAGRIESAYAQTTKAYQARQSLEQFRDLIEKNPALQKQTSSMVNPTQMNPGLCTFTATVSGPAGAVSCTIHVIKEGEQWKIDRFSIP